VPGFKQHSSPPFAKLSNEEKLRAYNLALFLTAKDLRAKGS
jgi:hypothetical protein